MTAIDEAIRRAMSGFTTAPDLVVSFVTAHHRAAVAEIAARLASMTSVDGVSLGAVSTGVIGGSEEFESGAAVVVWAGWLDKAEITALRMVAHRTDRGIGIAGADVPDETRGVVLLADPYTFPAGQFAESLGAVPVVGGIPSAIDRGTTLFLNGQVFENGAVAVALSGEVLFRAVVSQGCEPIGLPVIVTRAAGRVIEEIAGEPAVSYIEQLIASLDELQQEQAAQGLQIGVAIDEYVAEHGRGDYLIRPVTGADREVQAILVGDEITVGTTIQFHIRDPRSASSDLNESVTQLGQGGMLMFACNGRGERFFGSPHHDAALVAEACHPAALAGMVAGSEIGPVGGTSFIHTFTASIVELGEPI